MTKKSLDQSSSGSFGATLRSAIRGRASAISQLFIDLIPSLTAWARGRLPAWARARVDTDDLVQDAVLGVLGRLPKLESRRRRAIRAYLRQSIRHRIADEIRRAGTVEVPAGEDLDRADASNSPLTQAVDAEQEVRFRVALSRLSSSDQELIVGRLDLAYSYEQLALATGRRSPDAARVGVRRALLRLAEEMTE